jgi:hypothetical protein
MTTIGSTIKSPKTNAITPAKGAADEDRTAKTEELMAAVGRMMHRG